MRHACRKRALVGEPVGRGDDPPNSHQKSPEHKRNLELRIEIKEPLLFSELRYMKNGFLVPFVQWLGHRLFMSKTRALNPTLGAEWCPPLPNT
ncbi:hypothetical protein Lal_00041067 [Lupinus albus]|nr:hypothetical protein Lal_00041067 [Lupinus albus]